MLRERTRGVLPCFHDLRFSFRSVSCISQVDSKMNLANKNLGAIYGSMGRMVLSTQITTCV